MKGFLLWLFLFAAALSFLNVEITSLFPDPSPAHCGDDVAVFTSSRKLKEITRPSTNAKAGRRSIDLDDYLPIDPAPSSKASIQPGPIEHSAPLNPFIPKSPPPDPPKGAPLP